MIEVAREISRLGENFGLWDQMQLASSSSSQLVGLGEEEPWLKDRSKLLKKLNYCFNSHYKKLIHYFSAEQLCRVTQGFSEPIFQDNSQVFFGGYMEERSILVAKYFDPPYPDFFEAAINNIVISSQVSNLKNFLNFIGCCLEFKQPALVYKIGSPPQLLSDFFSSNYQNSFLPWGWESRIKIAKDIATAISHLHTLFSNPFIHTDLNPSRVIDQDGYAKLFNFSSCTPLPPGKMEVKQDYLTTAMYGYLDPENALSGKISTKTDVYSFGILMLELLAGRSRLMMILSTGMDILDSANQMVDSRILGTELEEGEEKQLQFRAFLDLALSCTQDTGADRPDMIHVAKELCQIHELLESH